MRLRGYQDEAVDAALRCVESGSSPLIQLPTGAGKSLVAAELCKRFAGLGRVLVVTHVQELVKQDADTISQWLGEDVGICAAGVKRFELDRPVTVASVQTITSPKRLPTLPTWDLVIVDEAHLVGTRDQSRYQKLRLVASCPWIGLTATPWRLDGGYLTEMDGVPFDDVAYVVEVGDLIAAGHLSPLAAYSGSDSIDPGAIRSGEFVIAEQVGSAMGLVGRHADEILRRGRDRRSWLVFATSIQHARSLSEALTARGAASHIISQETPADDRQRLVAGHRAGEVRCLVSVGVLTTGFDSPGTDLVVLARATASSSLFVQMVGRGLRTAPGKADCMVIDYGGNFVRHGPIDSPLIGCHGTATDEVRAKVCPGCGGVVRVRDTSCHLCGDLSLPPRQARESRLTATDSHRTPVIVSGVESKRVTTKAGTAALTVRYRDRHGGTIGTEWLFPEGPERWKRGMWRGVWLDRGGSEPVPRSASEASARWDQEIPPPISILYTPGKIPGTMGSVRWSAIRRSSIAT